MAQNLLKKIAASATLALSSLTASSHAADYIQIERGFLGMNPRVTHVQTAPAIGYVPQQVIMRDQCGRPFYGTMMMPVQTEVVTSEQVLHGHCYVPALIPCTKIIPVQPACPPTVIYAQPSIRYIQPAPRVLPQPIQKHSPIQKSPVQAPLVPIPQRDQNLPEPIQTPPPTQNLQPLQNPRQAPQPRYYGQQQYTQSLTPIQPNPYGWHN